MPNPKQGLGRLCIANSNLIGCEYGIDQLIHWDAKMPVRKVSHHGKNIIGRFPSVKLERMVAYESLLELDFLYLLDFERDVITYEEQPVTIDYEHNRKQLRYTPDFILKRLSAG